MKILLGVSGLETVAFHQDWDLEKWEIEIEKVGVSRIRKVIQIYQAKFEMSVDKQLGKDL